MIGPFVHAAMIGCTLVQKSAQSHLQDQGLSLQPLWTKDGLFF